MIKYLALLLIFSCTTTPEDFRLDKVKLGSNIVLAKFSILTNLKDKPASCVICMDKNDCYELDEKGWFFYDITGGERKIDMITCNQNHYTFEPYDLYFDIPYSTKNNVYYIGDFHIYWKNLNAFKVSAMYGALGTIVDQSVNDGDLKMKISRDFSGAEWYVKSNFPERYLKVINVKLKMK